MMRWFRRKPTSRRHPTAEQALDALSQGRCMYAATGSACSGSGKLEHAGLRSNEDANNVLVCGAHYGRLRQFPLRELNLLERVLVEAFFRPPAPTPPEPNDLRLVRVRRAS